MRYCSTRGQENDKSFEEILFKNYGSDGGMFMPESVPKLDFKTLQLWSKLSYIGICKHISRLFISEEEIPDAHLNEIIDKAFSNVFDHDDIVPVVKVGEIYVAELWHGPTLAFKDLAMTCVAQFMDYFGKKNSRHVTALVATSGDTGSSAIHCVRQLESFDIICIFPKGACSFVQELQMTTVIDETVHVFCGEGCSDDFDIVLQDILKQADLVEKYNLCTINSANWARIMIQIVHFFHVYFQVSDNIGDQVSIVVPTGAMGNATAGCIAYLMGLPIKITCATNVNDTVHQALSHGMYFPKQVSKTIAPAMDIQVPSNFERVIFVFSGSDDVQEFVANYKKDGKSEVPYEARKKMSAVLNSNSVLHDQMLNIMKESWFESKYLIDPHTATGIHVAFEESRLEKNSCCKCAVLSTAHIDKFLETLALINIEHKPSEKIQNLHKKPTRFMELKKEDNWHEIILNTISIIDERAKN